MIKKNIFKIIFSSLFTLSPIAFGLALWDKLPTVMATHWGVNGEADGFSSRTFTVFGLPIILFVLNLVCFFITSLDTKNKHQNKKALNMIFFIMPIISIFASSVIYAVAFGKTFDLSIAFPILLGLLFIIMGNLMPKVRQNNTLGFKFKWTLQSEENWNATHRFGGKIMVLAGFLMLFTMLLPAAAMMITAFAIILVSLISVVIYSYRYCLIELENEDTEFEPIYNKKSYFIAGIISAILVLVILGSTTYVMFSGDVTVTYTDDGFTVDSDYSDPLSLNFTDIKDVDFYDEMEVGDKVMGFNGATISVGKFKNKALGEHTRYTYNNCSAAVVIESNGKLLVINAKTTEATKEIYERISSKLHTDTNNNTNNNANNNANNNNGFSSNVGDIDITISGEGEII